jgi:ABC-type branched-subunit amino acid transport system ATPase component
MSAAEMPDLLVRNATVRFGGRVAVDDVSLQCRGGAITGLIGPNGAGKTTTFNACTGLVELAAGEIRLGETTLNGKSTFGRAKLGLGRTFQRMELFDSMSALENVSLGLEAKVAARAPWAQLVSGRRTKDVVRSHSMEYLSRCGITGFGSRLVGDLSTGQRRLVELARALAAGFRFLLLDEPSSGLDVYETMEFGRILAEYVAETSVGILLVEHDMGLVSSICSEIHVLDFGRLLFSGPTDEVLASPIVQAAYLGSSAVDLAVDV